MSHTIKVIQIGLGSIGNRITRYLLQKKAFRIVGALDSDVRKVGRDVGDLAGLPPIGVEVSDDPASLAGKGAEIAVLTTVSSLKTAQPQIMDTISQGMNLVSTCEELAYPWLRQADIAGQIDRAATAKGVSVLGTGINPGFLMDCLPLVMTGVCLQVHRLTVERIQDASLRRLPFQKKIGVGLSLAEFNQRAAARTLRHVGLTESMQMIADRLGYRLERTEDLIEPVLAREPVTARNLTADSGEVIGIHQTGRGYRDGQESIRLVFRASIGEPESFDRVRIEGTPDIDLRISGGINGDIGTGAITVNALPFVINAAPGLRTMADLPLVACVV
ncbi:MAG: dihydrodipicolinate reductase [Acidobacteriota bacterium]